MRKFVFKLEAVLNQRKRREEMMQKELAAALTDMQESEHLLSHKDQDLEKARSRQQTTGVGDVSTLIDNRRFIEHLYLEKNRLVQELNDRRRVVAHKRFLLMQASKEREALTRLKEKQRQTWRLEQLKEEQKELDEVGLNITRQGGGV